MSQPKRCAIAGLGRIGSTLEKDPLREKPASHAGAILACPDADLIAGADPEEERRDEFVADWGTIPTYPDARAMVRETHPDILHIAAWTETHPELLQMALEEGVPVIVCEKPLADDRESVFHLMDLASSGNSLVVMNHERRFSGDYRRARDLIRSKDLGELRSIGCRLYMGRRRTVDKVIYHDGTHMLDILRFLTGENIRIRSVVGDAGAEGGGLFIVMDAGDAAITMEIAGGRDHLVFEFDLSFESGRVRIGNGIFEIWESEESPYYTGFRSLRRTQDAWDGPTGYFLGMMCHAVALAADPTMKNESSIEDGYAVLELIDEILSAAGS